VFYHLCHHINPNFALCSLLLLTTEMGIISISGVHCINANLFDDFFRQSHSITSVVPPRLHTHGPLGHLIETFQPSPPVKSYFGAFASAVAIVSFIGLIDHRVILQAVSVRDIILFKKSKVRCVVNHHQWCGITVPPGLERLSFCSLRLRSSLR